MRSTEILDDSCAVPGGDLHVGAYLLPAVLGVGAADATAATAAAAAGHRLLRMHLPGLVLRDVLLAGPGRFVAAFELAADFLGPVARSERRPVIVHAAVVFLHFLAVSDRGPAVLRAPAFVALAHRGRRRRQRRRTVERLRLDAVQLFVGPLVVFRGRSERERRHLGTLVLGTAVAATAAVRVLPLRLLIGLPAPGLSRSQGQALGPFGPVDGREPVTFARRRRQRRRRRRRVSGRAARKVHGGR